MFTRLTLIVAIFASVTLGCGEDSQGNNGIFNNVQKDTGGEDMDGSDAGTDMDRPDATADGGTDMADGGSNACQEVTCRAGEFCDEGNCVARDACDGVLDAGTLAIDGSVTIDGSFLETGSDTLAATCGEPDQLEQLVQFELTEEAIVRWSAEWGPQFDGLVALQTACDDSTTETQCSDSENGSVQLSPGVYFLLLEVRIGNASTFSVDISAEAPGICELGSATCDGDDREVCVGGTTVETETCPETCSSGSCGGDACAAPITVTGSGGTFTGTGRAMTSQLDYSGNTDCAQQSGMSTSTPGYEVVFFLPNLMAGQVVSIDARTNDSNINDIFVQQTCGDTAVCTASYQGSEDPDFVVMANGDYFVVIEKRQVSNAPFEYSISIQ